MLDNEEISRHFLDSRALIHKPISIHSKEAEAALRILRQIEHIPCCEWL